MTMKLIIAIRCIVDDEAEATSIREAVATAMEPFEELSPTVTASVSQNIDPVLEPEEPV